jgi:phosphoglycolate phosphatase
VIPAKLIFDLDGTLVDSIPMCLLVLDAMLAARNAPMRACPEITRQNASIGGEAMIAAVMGDYCPDPARDVEEFRARYAVMPTPRSSLYPGVRKGLQTLREMGITLAVCTNKPQHLCDKVLADLGLSGMFQIAVGSRPGVAKKPAPDLMALTLAGLETTPQLCTFVGDSDLDRDVAAHFSMDFVMVTWGYGNAEEMRSVPQAADFPALVQLIVGASRSNARAA